MSQLGSYGEAVFHAHCKAQGLEIIPLHVGRADFLVNGTRVDVKTSRKNLANVLTEPKLRVRNERHRRLSKSSGNRDDIGR